MTDITIGPKFKKRLNEISKDFFSIAGDWRSPHWPTKYSVRSSVEDVKKARELCGDPALIDMWLKGTDNHSGFPEQHFASPISKMVRMDPEIWSDFQERVKFDFAKELGAHSSALLNFYTIGGFVGWHTNWNSPSYQILLTWSSTGKSFFRFWDKSRDNGDHPPKTSHVKTIHEVPGWQAKWFYFGHRHEHDHHLWHCAWSGCNRLTLAYKFTNGNGLHDAPADGKARDMLDMAVGEMKD